MDAIAKHFGHPAHMPRAGLPEEIGPGRRVPRVAAQLLHDRSEHQRRRRFGLHLTVEIDWPTEGVDYGDGR